MLEILKRQTVAANRLLLQDKMSRDSKGTITAIDRETNKVIICPNGAANKLENLVLLSLDEDYKTIRNVDFPRDIVLHISLYKKHPDITSIAHVYPVWCSTFSRAGKGIPMCDIINAKKYGSEIPCVGEWGEFDAEDDVETIERKRAENALAGINVESQGVVLLHNDGVLSWATNPMQALLQTKPIATIAQKTARAEFLGGAERIPSDIAAKYHEEYIQNQLKEAETKSNGVPGDPVSRSEQKKINLELLIYFDEVCRANGIKYSLTGGTLLGAIRHGGFIPWDDDVDVFLTRPEYDKLPKAFPDNNRFVYVDRNKDPNHNFVYGRIVDTRTYIAESPSTKNAGAGLFLDVSPVEGLPNNALLRKLHIRYMRTLVRLRRSTIHSPTSKAYNSRGRIHRLLKKIVRTLTTHHFWNRRLEKVMGLYSFEKSKFVGNFTSQYGKREMLHKEAFDSYFDVEFEGHKFMVCQGYEEYLNNIYGNYLSYPHRKTRKGHHVYKAYWVENPSLENQNRSV